MNAAMMTMNSENMTVWFSPTTIVGTAIGRDTFHSLWPRVAPDMSAASRRFGGTPLSPSIV